MKTKEEISKILAAHTLVPIGPNVTRDGRAARVICIDSGSEKFPVIYLSELGSPISVNAAGSYLNNNTLHPKDLVGHLPPEPIEVTTMRGEPDTGLAAADILRRMRDAVDKLHVSRMLIRRLDTALFDAMKDADELLGPTAPNPVISP